VQITEKEIQDKARALSNLVSFKGKSEKYILSRARDILHKERFGVDMTTMFTDRKEVRRSRELLEKYLDDYTIESISDKNTLKEVIYLEIVQQRLQEKLNEYYKKDSKAVPIQLVEIIHKNSTAILALKSVLGLNREKEKSSSINALAALKIRFKQWLKENQGSRTLVCPHENCGKMIMLKINTDAWEAQKHPFFKDRILANKHLVHLFMNKVITVQDVAQILGASPDYVDWLVERWSNNEHQVATQVVTEKQKKEEKQAKQTIDLEESGNVKQEITMEQNRCKECGEGFLFCSLDDSKDAISWKEQCTNCDYKATHENRRTKQVGITFKNRRDRENNDKSNTKEKTA